MKKYLVFAGSYYFRGCGVKDLVGDADTIEGARAVADVYLDSLEDYQKGDPFWSIVEHSTMTEIESDES